MIIVGAAEQTDAKTSSSCQLVPVNRLCHVLMQSQT